MTSFKRLFSTLILAGLPFQNSFAGTDTGCSGDQWGYGNTWVHRTGKLWEIHAPGGNGCGTVSKRSASKKDILMSNKICQFQFESTTAVLTINSMRGKSCSCAGKIPLEMTCIDGKGGMDDAEQVCQGEEPNLECRFEINDKLMQDRLKKRNDEIQKRRK